MSAMKDLFVRLEELDGVLETAIKSHDAGAHFGTRCILCHARVRLQELLYPLLASPEPREGVVESQTLMSPAQVVIPSALRRGGLDG